MESKMLISWLLSCDIRPFVCCSLTFLIGDFSCVFLYYFITFTCITLCGYWHKSGQFGNAQETRFRRAGPVTGASSEGPALQVNCVGNPQVARFLNENHS